jgi:hypothetical protein
MISKDYLASFVFVALLVVNLMNIMNWEICYKFICYNLIKRI